jgi:(p)ppGpp synthase/HD superfamily hydrolase
MKKEISTLDELIEAASYITNADEIDTIKKAYEFAYNVHKDEKRLSGDDYILHPLNVAYILTSLYADSDTLATALLHDVIHKGNSTIEEVQKNFSKEISTLVEGITTINKLSLSAENESMVNYYKKILVGLTEDVRIIIIKLAERCHNMRTLWAIPKEKQRLKAKETLEILAPIAHRLGLSYIKAELEELSLKYYKPEAFDQIEEELNSTKEERDKSVEEMKKRVSDILIENNIEFEIKGRAKSIYSIYNKLQKGKKLSDIYDIYALRVIVNTKAECYQVLGLIHAKYKPLPKRFKDYIANPKTNMYQSLHTTVFGFDGKPYEIQIRTFEMDKVAERGIASHWSYKEQGKKIAVLIDYKTGNTDIDLGYIKDGINLQLPVYLYLVNEELKNVVFAGFYLQKLINKDNKDLKLEGYSNSNVHILSMFDKSYENSNLVKSLKVTKSGNFYSYSKILSDDEIKKIIELTNESIDKSIKNIEDVKFDINPKISDDFDSCKYCPFNDLCFKTNDDYIEIKKDLTFLKGEDYE